MCYEPYQRTIEQDVMDTAAKLLDDQWESVRAGAPAGILDAVARAIQQERNKRPDCEQACCYSRVMGDLKASMVRRSGASSWDEAFGEWNPAEECAADCIKRLVAKVAALEVEFREASAQSERFRQAAVQAQTTARARIAELEAEGLALEAERDRLRAALQDVHVILVDLQESDLEGLDDARVCDVMYEHSKRAIVRIMAALALSTPAPSEQPSAPEGEPGAIGTVRELAKDSGMTLVEWVDKFNHVTFKPMSEGEAADAFRAAMRTEAAHE